MRETTNPNAWEWDFDRDLHPSWAPGEWRYQVVKTIRENRFRSAIRDDPEHEKVHV